MPQVLPLTLGGRRQGRIRPELEPILAALAELGDPQLAAPSILVVGTNGKGSTAVMLEAVLRAHGLHTGLATSPHLVSVTERVRLDGRPIDDDELARHLDRLAAHPRLTYFETVTAAAFLAFAQAAVDVAILEAGLGGTWDATRAAASAIAGITNVGSDHPQWLGETAEERARDKGAALAAARWAVVGPDLNPELLPALEAPAAVRAGDLVELLSEPDGRVTARWEGHELTTEVPLAGSHQVGNLHLALALARCAASSGLIGGLEPVATAAGLEGVRWPGRLTECRIGGRAVLVDGAHNLEGARALAIELERRGDRYSLLFSCLDDKPVEAMAHVLGSVVGAVVVCELDDERAMPAARMADAFEGARCAPDIAAALELLPDPVLAAGSLRLAGRLVELAGDGGCAA